MRNLVAVDLPEDVFIDKILSRYRCGRSGCRRQRRRYGLGQPAGFGGLIFCVQQFTLRGLGTILIDLLLGWLRLDFLRLLRRYGQSQTENHCGHEDRLRGFHVSLLKGLFCPDRYTCPVYRPRCVLLSTQLGSRKLAKDHAGNRLSGFFVAFSLPPGSEDVPGLGFFRRSRWKRPEKGPRKPGYRATPIRKRV